MAYTAVNKNGNNHPTISIVAKLPTYQADGTVRLANDGSLVGVSMEFYLDRHSLVRSETEVGLGVDVDHIPGGGRPITGNLWDMPHV